MLTNRIGNTSLVNSSDVIKNSDVSDYVELLKPRVMSLAIFTAIMGMLLAPSLPHPVLAIFFNNSYRSRSRSGWCYKYVV